MKNDEFDDWCKCFSADRKGKAALNDLKAQYQDDNQEEFPQLEKLVLEGMALT